MESTDTRLTRAITPAFLNPKSSKPRPNAVAFMHWIRQGLMDGSLTYNQADSDVHFVRDGMAITCPNIIKRYLLKHEFIGELVTTPDAWKAVGREVDKSGYIVRNTVTKSCLHAYQVLNRDGSLGARKIWVRLIPNANAFIWPLPSVNTRLIACEVAQPVPKRTAKVVPIEPVEDKVPKTMKTKSRIRVLCYPYKEATAQGLIEAQIADLTEALNIDGICGTRACCAGHGWPWITVQRPYVAFVCDMPWSCELSRLVDELLASNKLTYCWTVRGQHVKDFGLSWRFSIEDSRSFIKRRLINQDFETLAKAIRLLGAEFQQRVIASDIDVGKKGKDAKNHQVLKPRRFHDFSKGIGIQTFGATGC